MPKNGKEGITVSLDADLIAVIDYVAGRLDVSRSQFIKDASKMYIAVQLSEQPEFWDRVYHGVNNRTKQKQIF